MRWEDRQLEVADSSALPGLQRMAGLVRSVRTPEFEGVTFHEVMCKSALNRVPTASHVPFSRTVNPYRGCTHACTYCLSGDTEVLMSDGSARPLATLRVGDRVVGTRGFGSRRRYVATVVLDHWETRRSAVSVELADGTTLVASGDHRFLTIRGWCHVMDAPTGVGRRHLDVGDQLMGFGFSGTQPEVHGAAGALPHESSTDVVTAAGLRVAAVRDLGVATPMFDISTGTGDFVANGVVSHNCFARGTHTYLDLDAGDDFDREVVVKVNVAEVLRREVAKPSWTHEHVAMGTNTDPYQRAEGRYRLMPGIINALTDSGTPFSILTKGTLLRRDLPLLSDAAHAIDVSVGVSLAMLDEDLHRSVEPGTPTPRARLELIRAIRRAGLPCNVLVAPVLPGLTDSPDHLDALIGAVARAGATGVSVIPLHLRPGAREWYLRWLQQYRPDLAPRYRRLYASGAYAHQRYRTWLHDRVRPLLRKHGMDGRRDQRSHRWDQAARSAPKATHEPTRSGQQDTLFDTSTLFS